MNEHKETKKNQKKNEERVFWTFRYIIRKIQNEKYRLWVGPKMVNSKTQLDFQRRGASNEVTSQSKLSIVLKACFRCGQRDLSRLVFDSRPVPSDPRVAGESTVQAWPL